MHRSSSTLILLLLTWCSVITPTAHASEPKPTKEAALIDLFLNHAVEQLARKVPGIAAAWQQGDEAPFFFTTGKAQLNPDQPITRQHWVRAGSVLTMAVGTLVLQLADDGELFLDDPVSQYLNGIPIPNGDQITLRMLGNHTSGIANVLDNPTFRQRIHEHPARHFTHREIIDLTFANGPASRPGRKFHYSHTNIILLAEVIQAVTKKPWQELLQSRVLKPLGANHSQVPSGSTASLPAPYPAPHGYHFGREDSAITPGKKFLDVTAIGPSFTGAAGDWITTIDDLLAIARPLAKGALLSERMRDEQRAWVKTDHRSMRYGFCLAEWHRHILGHPGEAPGFSTFVAWNPATDACVITWCNLSNTSGQPNPAEELGLKFIEGVRD